MRATGPSAVEWYRPNVVERHVAEKRVAAQVEPLEVGRVQTDAELRL
jgi:hypothetical protein